MCHDDAVLTSVNLEMVLPGCPILGKGLGLGIQVLGHCSAILNVQYPTPKSNGEARFRQPRATVARFCRKRDGKWTALPAQSVGRLAGAWRLKAAE